MYKALLEIHQEGFFFGGGGLLEQKPSLGKVLIFPGTTDCIKKLAVTHDKQSKHIWEFLEKKVQSTLQMLILMIFNQLPFGYFPGIKW